MLYRYLVENYKEWEPIFLQDLDFKGKTVNNLRVQMWNLVESGKLYRYEPGIYYLPLTKYPELATRPLPRNIIDNCKYVSRRGNVFGYELGFGFANTLGLTLQVPWKRDIRTNATTAISKDTGGMYVVKRSRVKINNENWRLLQLLDFLGNLYVYSDISKVETCDVIRKYITNNKFKWVDVVKYIEVFPDKVFRGLYEIGGQNVFAR